MISPDVVFFCEGIINLPISPNNGTHCVKIVTKCFYWRSYINISLNVVSSYSERPRGARLRSGNSAERWRENPARAKGLAGFSKHSSAGFTDLNPVSREGCFALIPHPTARWAIYPNMIHFVDIVTIYYRSGGHGSDVYKRDMLWRCENSAKPHGKRKRRDRLSEASGTLLIHLGVLTISNAH